MAGRIEEQGLVLSGGGANGAYEIGVLKGLLRAPKRQFGYAAFDPGIISGTSVGAVNAAMLLSADPNFGAAVNFLEQTWRERIADVPGGCGNGVYRFRADPVPYMDPRCLLRNPLEPLARLGADTAFLTQEIATRTLQFFRSSAPVEQRVIEFPDLSNFVDVSPLQQLLREVVDLERVRNSSRKIRVAATDWRRGRPRIFENSDLYDQRGYELIRGSTAIPGIFPPVSVEGDIFVDGGVTMNTPLKPAIMARRPETEHLVLHVIYLDPLVEDIPFPELPNTLSTFGRLTSIFMSGRLDRDVRSAVGYNRSIRLGHRLESQVRRQQMTGLEDTLRPIRKEVKGRIPITIHRHRPPPVAVNPLQLLDFSAGHIEQLIQLGEESVRTHDCDANRCALD